MRGDAGCGKSALLRHLIDAATGFSVVHATGVESEIEVPFAALHQLCASLLNRLDTLPVPQRDAARMTFGLTAGASPDRLLIGLAILSLLSSAADEGPLLCVVDDAQWLDRASVQALTFVARRLLADRIALVFATRQVNSDLAELPELVVEPLSNNDAQTLLSGVLSVPLDQRVRDRIVAETHGNPLALVEWPRDLTAAELAGGFGMPSLMPMTGQIQESFRRRLEALPLRTQRLLLVAAAEPTADPAIVWSAATDLGVGPHDAAPAIDAGLLDIGARMWFRHPLVRSAAYASASLTDRQAAHRALALATDPDLDPDRRSWHRALGSSGPDEEIAEALEHSAGRARARGGVAAAAAMLDRSVALSLDPSRRGKRIVAAAAAHLEAGSFSIAADLLASADSPALDDMSRAQLELLRARHPAVGGDVRDATRLYLGAAKRLESLDVGLAQQCYLLGMASAIVAGNFARGTNMLDIARAASSCPASAVPTTRGWLVAGLAQAAVHGPASAAPALRAAIEAAAADTTDPASVKLDGLLGYLCAAASTLWDSDKHHRFAALQVTSVRQIGGLTMLPWALNSFALVLTLEGDLDGAASARAEANQIIEATGGNLVSFASPTLAAWRGDDNSLRSIDELATSARLSGQGQALRTAQWASAILYNSLGQYEQAFAAAIEADQQPWPWGSYHCHELIEAAARCGQSAVAESALTRLAASVEGSGSEWGLGVYTRSHALLSTGADAEVLYNQAIGHLSRSPIRPELARAHLLYGEWLRRENRRVDARAQLRKAHDMFTAMGILAFAERTRHELLATGETVRKRTVESFDELTAQETHIAHLAADGCTNPEIGAQLFISSRTVEWHMRNVFTKLNITSRKELRATVRR